MRSYNTDPDDLGRQVAKKLQCSPDLIADIRVITSWEGAASLEVDIVDSDFEVLEGGALTPTDRKLTTTDPNIQEAEVAAGHGPYSLPVIDVNYPEGSDFWWRLSDISPQSALDGANLTLTFETRIVAYLRHHHGPPLKSMSRADGTRARFIKSITADEVKAAGGIRFISPEIDDPQPILEPDTGG